MNEWEAQYKALAMGIEDKKYIDNAKSFVDATIKLSLSSGHNLDYAFYLMEAAFSRQSHEANMINILEKYINDNLLKCLFKYFIYKIKKHLSKLKG